LTSFAKQYDIGGAYDSWTTAATASTAFTVLGSFACKAYKTKAIVLTAATTDIAYKVMGSIDSTNYDITVLSSASLTVGNSTYFQITDMYTDIQVQIAKASTAASTGGTMAGKYFGVTL
jgi:hypothetical protein